jgi:hypothetical protein
MLFQQKYHETFILLHTCTIHHTSLHEKQYSVVSRYHVLMSCHELPTGQSGHFKSETTSDARSCRYVRQVAHYQAGTERLLQLVALRCLPSFTATLYRKTTTLCNIISDRNVDSRFSRT